jgi:cellulose synthase/poly-beta-1,6-N-acetylglucosamine synthase-like glycosyltransferase
MGSDIRTGADVVRSEELFASRAGSPSTDPSLARAASLWAIDTANDDARHGFPELDCVRQMLPAPVLAAAERRAERLATGADRVLIAAGTLDDDTYLPMLGATLGVPFEPLDGMPRAQCPLDDGRLIEAAATGLLPLATEAGIVVVVAPRGLAARNIIGLIADAPETAARFRFTSADRFNRFVMRGAGNRIAANASDRLKRDWPMLSAASPHRLGNIASMTSIVLLALTGFGLAPGVTAHVFEIGLAAVFVAWLALRLIGAFVRRPAAAVNDELLDEALPIYSVICALYHEASSVNGLLSAFEKLDYPPEKLDVILAIEADDTETLAVIAARKTRTPITVIAVPAMGPRTKPKALNVALPFARGAFTVVYDAEDRPEPDQLRCALQAFRTAGDDLACVQARLCIDNTADSPLARYYTAEYAGQFDVFLPGLTAMGLPLPLGGSSNHFDTATLRKIGGWDPYNVTEDADLGMRLARFGYRSEMIWSTTYEEAPAHVGPWLRQRTRWFKGWMQTWLVHMRQPGRLLRELGRPGFLGFQLMVGGNALAALVHPLFMTGLIVAIASGNDVWQSGGTPVGLGALYGSIVIIGYLSSGFLGWLGLMQRGLTLSAWVLLLTPVHWLLLSVAAWRAVYQLVFAPFVWEKTAHGLAKTSHRAAKITRALLELERELEALKKSGRLPVVNAATDTSAARRRRLRASASS